MLNILFRNRIKQLSSTSLWISWQDGLQVPLRAPLQLAREAKDALPGLRYPVSNRLSRGLTTTVRTFTNDPLYSSTSSAETSSTSRNESPDASNPQHVVVERLGAAFRNGSFESIASALALCARDSGIFKSLPATTFRSLLQELSGLRKFIDSLRTISRGFHPTIIDKHGELRQPRDMFKFYEDLLRSVFAQWEAMDGRLGLLEYTSLLDMARTLRDGDFARDVWTSMRKNEVVPDTRCYNYYYEARCWHLVYDQFEDYNFRVTKRNLRNRAVDMRKRWTRLRSYTTGPGGLRQEVVSTFEGMLESGAPANATTYTYFLLALGREGDLRAVRDIMKKAWAIDVVDITHHSDNATVPTSGISVASSLFPSQLLLFTIAHVFGANNQLSTAIEVVDYVARTFSLDISLDTWDELMSWAYVLSTERSEAVLARPERSDEADGQLPVNTVERIWQTMTAAPYHCQPTIRMWDLRIRSLFKQETDLPTVIEVMESARDHMKRHEDCLATPQYLGENVHTEFLHTLRARCLTLFTLWTKLALSKFGRLHPEDPKSHDLRLRKLQSFLLEWSRYVDEIGAAYNIPSGRVQFHVWGRNSTITQGSKTIKTTFHTERNAQGRLIVKAAEKCSSKPHLGLTRYTRLRRRHKIRARRGSFSTYPDAPPEVVFKLREFQVKPAWHESKLVQNA